MYIYRHARAEIRREQLSKYCILDHDTLPFAGRPSKSCTHPGIRTAVGKVWQRIATSGLDSGPGFLFAR